MYEILVKRPGRVKTCLYIEWSGGECDCLACGLFYQWSKNDFFAAWKRTHEPTKYHAKWKIGMYILVYIFPWIFPINWSLMSFPVCRTYVGGYLYVFECWCPLSLNKSSNFRINKVNIVPFSSCTLLQRHNCQEARHSQTWS